MTDTQARRDTLALSADEVQSRYGIDLTTAEVLRHALRHVALQMQLKVNTAALSPLLSEVNDFGIGLLAPRDTERDLDFDALAMASAAPAHYVINQFYARMAIEHWGVERFQPGDVLIYNDPYRGGSHVNDVGTLMPIFDGDDLLGFAVAITHWLDIGGPVPAGMGAGLQRDMYAEGIKLTPRKLYDRGELVPENLELFTEQTRIPDITINDLQVIKSALQIGSDMVLRYARRYGTDLYRAAAQYTLDFSERTVRSSLLEVPDGVYESQDYLDNNMDGEPMLVRCTVRKHGDNVEVDYSGTCREEWGGYASQWSDTVSAAHLGVVNILDTTAMDLNAGAYRPIHVVAPPGSCLSALPPMSTNAGHTMFFTKALNLVKLALSQASPELAVAENYDDVGVLGFVGVDDRAGTYNPFITIRALCGPFGGTAVDDGCSMTLVEGGNCLEPSIELDEEAFPVLVLSREFVADTAGVGKHRGGPSTEMIVTPQVPVHMTYQLDQCRFPTQGVLGGGDGARASIVVYRGGLDAWARGETLPAAEVMAGFANTEDGTPASYTEENSPGVEFRNSKGAGKPVMPGDIVVLRLPGAGGYGPAAERDDEAVRKDVRDGIYSSPAHAVGR